MSSRTERASALTAAVAAASASGAGSGAPDEVGREGRAQRERISGAAAGRPRPRHLEPGGAGLVHDRGDLADPDETLPALGRAPHARDVQQIRRLEPEARAASHGGGPRPRLRWADRLLRLEPPPRA